MVRLIVGKCSGSIAASSSAHSRLSSFIYTIWFFLYFSSFHPMFFALLVRTRMLSCDSLHRMEAKSTDRKLDRLFQARRCHGRSLSIVINPFVHIFSIKPHSLFYLNPFHQATFFASLPSSPSFPFTNRLPKHLQHPAISTRIFFYSFCRPEQSCNLSPAPSNSSTRLRQSPN